MLRYKCHCNLKCVVKNVKSAAVIFTGELPLPVIYFNKPVQTVIDSVGRAVDAMYKQIISLLKKKGKHRGSIYIKKK